MTTDHIRIRGMLICRSRDGVSIFGENNHPSVPERLYPEDLPEVIEFLSKVMESPA